MKKQWISILALLMIMPFAATAQKLRIAVAANAQFVAGVLAKAFKQQTGIKAELIVGSSGKLTAQIEQRAPFDAFLSADMKYPQELFDKGFTTGKPKVYAYGALVVWSKQPLKAGLASLKENEFRKVAIANPALAPYGEAAMQALKKLKLADDLQPKIVYGESVAQVNQYLLTGAVDAAFTAKSVVFEPAQKSIGAWTEVSNKLYRPIAQGVVIIKPAAGKNSKYAQAFYNFLFSAKAKQIFKQYGYR
ncbi:molybdate ABC transporter substrate-binding protein [Mucilaginibacter sp. PAMB04274]|uniref:molybdate ABC transporter substrate-binding protein n=1 Tax=Mucilaginibacter sp. PAMB04274 TaxID=3138568 RepID=UPI0031F6FBE1